MALAVRRALRALITAALLGATIVAPAAAASSGSPDAAYYDSVVTSVKPAMPGLNVSVSAKDATVTVANATGRTVTVVGYANEDFLRITPDGVYENTNALTSQLNGASSPDELSPAKLAAAAQQPPHWVSRGTGPSATWHDFRVVWTNTQRPPVVVADPHSAHQVFSWGLALRVDSEPVLVLGEVRWTGVPWLTTAQTVLLGLALIVLMGLAFRWIRKRRTPHPGRRRPLAAPPLRGGAAMSGAGH